MCALNLVGTKGIEPYIIKKKILKPHQLLSFFFSLVREISLYL